MSGIRSALAAFAAAEAAAWPGLPAGLTVPDVAGLVAFDPADVRRGEVGDPPRTCGWIPLDTSVYAGGLRMWVQGEQVLALEGDHPLDGRGEFRPAPELGPPDAALETLLGPLQLEGGELVYAARGLAVRVNPENGLLLGLVGFAQTSIADYRSRIRPVQEQPHPIRAGVIA